MKFKTLLKALPIAISTCFFSGTAHSEALLSEAADTKLVNNLLDSIVNYSLKANVASIEFNVGSEFNIYFIDSRGNRTLAGSPNHKLSYMTVQSLIERNYIRQINYKQGDGLVSVVRIKNLKTLYA
jgi:hypothetical protein